MSNTIKVTDWANVLRQVVSHEIEYSFRQKAGTVMKHVKCTLEKQQIIFHCDFLAKGESSI